MDSIKQKLENLDIWDLYNSFFMSEDIERIRKFLAREHLFKMSLSVPGDIVEVGVFKGIGISQLIKLKEIFIPSSNKKIIGFDLFSSSSQVQGKLTGNDKELDKYYSQCNVNMLDGIEKKDVEYFLNKIKVSNTKYLLVEGDVKHTIKKYVNDNPGFRISYLYLDLDIEEPTLISLELLYERVVKGGIIVFDEYACDKWTESNAVDKFLEKHKNLSLKTLQWARTPTAYIIKE